MNRPFTRRQRTLIIIGLFLGFTLLAVVALTDLIGAPTLSGNGYGNGVSLQTHEMNW